MVFSQFIHNRASNFDANIAYLEDKVNSNKEVSKTVVPVPKIYHTLSKPEELLSIELPEDCVIKFNNLSSSKSVVFRKSGAFKGFSSLKEVVVHLKRNNQQHRKCQASIKQILQKVIIEELLLDSSKDTDLRDIKLYCFNGRVEYVLITQNFVEKRTWRHYDRNFNRIKIQVRDDSLDLKDEKPKYLNQIIEYGDILASKFCPNTMVRIDFFSTTQGPVFGEFTFNPNGGNGFDLKADIKMGNLLRR
jgi:hypothetical protein